MTPIHIILILILHRNTQLNMIAIISISKIIPWIARSWTWILLLLTVVNRMNRLSLHQMVEILNWFNVESDKSIRCTFLYICIDIITHQNNLQRRKRLNFLSIEPVFFRADLVFFFKTLQNFLQIFLIVFKVSIPFMCHKSGGRWNRVFEKLNFYSFEELNFTVKWNGIKSMLERICLSVRIKMFFLFRLKICTFHSMSNVNLLLKVRLSLFVMLI